MDLMFLDRARYLMDVDDSLDLLRYSVRALLRSLGATTSQLVYAHYKILRIGLSAGIGLGNMLLIPWKSSPHSDN